MLKHQISSLIEEAATQRSLANQVGLSAEQLGGIVGGALDKLIEALRLMNGHGSFEMAKPHGAKDESELVEAKDSEPVEKPEAAKLRGKGRP